MASDGFYPTVSLPPYLISESSVEWVGPCFLVITQPPRPGWLIKESLFWFTAVEDGKTNSTAPVSAEFLMVALCFFSSWRSGKLVGKII